MPLDPKDLADLLRFGGYAYRTILHLRRGEIAFAACAAVLAIGFGIVLFAG